MSMKVLVDSSVWIDVLRNQQSPHGDILRQLVTEGFAYTTGVIQAEILPFVRSSEAARVDALFSNLSLLELESQSAFWRSVVHWRTQMVRSGLAGVGLPDVLIATTALETGVPLWSLDNHFARIAEKLPLQLWT